MDVIKHYQRRRRRRANCPVGASADAVEPTYLITVAKTEEKKKKEKKGEKKVGGGKGK